MTLEPADYWKLRSAAATASAKHLEGQLREAQATRCYTEAAGIVREAFAVAGIVITPRAALVFDDATFTVTVQGEPNATPT